MLERLVMDKHYSVLRKFVNYVRKKFYNIGNRWTRFEPAAPETKLIDLVLTNPIDPILTMLID